MRQASLQRTTQETDIRVYLLLEGQGVANIQTGLGFLDHMLTQIARHGRFDLTIQAQGDLQVDGHHTVEDIGIALGQAFHHALGERRGIVRFASAYAPLDEALSRVVVDLSNRPHLSWRVQFPTPRLGQMETELFREWFVAFANHGGITLHVENFYGLNSHHIIESCFKALALALKEACKRELERDDVPSTKGTLS
ncbi:MAG: imidazoleglycerol-phosphate dehydratase HisB [Magnetococcus sp. DMHC-6]